MAASRTLVAHTTAASAIEVQIATNGTTVVTGTLDNNVSLLAGDVIVLVQFDTSTSSGSRGSFSKVSAGSSDITFEGSTAGSYSNSSYALTTGNADASGTISGTVKGVYLHSTRVNTVSDGNSHATIDVLGGYVGSSGTRRAAVYLLRPDTGKNIPKRTTRIVAANSTSDTTTGAGHTDNISLTYANSITGLDVCLLSACYPDGGTSGINVDADNDGSFELTSLDYTQQGSTCCISSAYASGSSHRPSTTVPVKYVANPGANGHVTTVTVYQLETVVNTVTGTASLSGGGTLSLSGTPTVNGTLAFSGGGNLHHINGTRTVLGTLALAGTGTLSANQGGHNNISGTASFSGGGVLSANGHRIITGTATLAGTASLAATGVRTVKGTLGFAGQGGITAQQLQAVTQYDAGGTWSSMSQVRVGGLTRTGTGSLSGGGTFAATGRTAAHNSGILTLAGGGILSLTGKRTTFGTMSLTGGGTFRMLSIPPSEPPSRMLLERDNTLLLDRDTNLVLEQS